MKSTLVVLGAIPLMGIASESVLPEIEVRASKPSSQFDQISTNDTAVGLSSLPGVSVYSAGGVSGLPVIRGLADDRIKTRVDGAEITSACGNHMNAPLSYVDPSQVRIATIIAGITPVSVGGDSIAGTIDISTGTPRFAMSKDEMIREGRLSLSGRSVDHSTKSAFQGNVATEQLSIGYSAAVSKAESYKDGAGNKVLDTLYKSTTQALTFGAKGERDLWLLKLGRQDIPYQGFPNQYMDMTKNEGVFANLGYSGAFDWGRLDAKMYWQDTRHRMGFFSAEKPGTMPMETSGRDIGYTLQAEIPLTPTDTLRLGQEFHHFALDDWWPSVAGSMMMGPNPYININSGTRQRLAAFAEWEGQLSSTWSSIVGFRHETVTTNTGNVQGYGCGMMCAVDTAAASAFNDRVRRKQDRNLDLTALFKYEMSPTASYEFGFAQKTRSPNLYERYTWGRGEMAMSMIGWYGDGNGYVGNIDLKHEVAHTVSATFDWHDGAEKTRYFRITPFYSRVQDFIDVDDLGAGMMMPRRLQFANHDATLHGVNVDWQQPLPMPAQLGKFDLRGKLDWTRGKRRDGGDLYHIMPLAIMLSMDQKIERWTNTVQLQAIGRKSRVDMQRLENVTGGYALVDLGTRYRASSSIEIVAGIRNLFDRNYELPLGGINLAASPTVPLRGQGRSIDLGVVFTF